MQILPALELSGFIKHYLFVETKTETTKKLRLFSDGNMGLVFSFKNKMIKQFSLLNIPAYLPDSFVYGQIKSYRDLYCNGETSLMIVVFHSYGLHALLGMSSTELIDGIVETENLFGSAATSLFDKLASHDKLDERIIILDNFFRSVLKKRPLLLQASVTASIQFILENKGITSVKQLTDLTGCNERKLERIFMEHLGIGPKKFTNIVKLHIFLKYLKTKFETSSLTTISYEAGYYDQPHLIREFKKYTGLTPSQYLKHANLLAVNFLELT
ncbi:helix-turn-helix domain-containing protein [Chryseobacterium ginsenosidimutans]|uniref:helix-turn-helix domain-containing protein n=1 Tax=Chryseobacterium ginsenosidimutans TaxID=687846 RepID=UPI0027B8F8A7|nr:helix-turn-helix domain-containing protein [Chryseobacterium ginsenosidimutans]